MNQEEPYFSLDSGIALSGTKYLELNGNGVSICIRVSDLSRRSGLEEALAAHQVVLTPSQRSRIVAEASRIREYPPKEYAERGGWVGAEHYIRGNGERMSPEGKATFAKVVFKPEQRGSGRSGSVGRWQSQVARRLTGQTLMQFLVMSAFAGAILPLTNRSLNILFEIVGDGGEGKSSAVAIAASVAGPSIDRGQGTAWFTPSGTTNWLEQRMVAHADATAFINEFQVFGAGHAPPARAQMVYDFIFRFSEGQTRGRLDGDSSLTYRGVAVLTANDGVCELMGPRHKHAINPTTSRLISLPGDAGFGCGTLDFIPEGEANGRTFVTSVLSATERQHGTAMPAFLQGLVDMRACDDAELRARIAAHIDDFIIQAAGGAGGLPARVAEAFAVVYVAGRLARHLGVLPKEWDPLAVALECYRRYCASTQLAEGRTVRELLRNHAAREDVLDLNVALPSLTDEELQSASGFRRDRKGGMELYIPSKAITRLFPAWTQLRDTADVANFLKRDGLHFTKQKVVRQGGKKDRVHVFSGFV